MKCLLRDAGTFLDIPGCSGVADDTGGQSVDYCVTPRWDMLDLAGNNGIPASAFPLQECQGDCDTDSDCDGNLKCFKRDGQEPIVGCYGKGESGEDYCYNPALVEGGCIKAKEVPGYNADGWDYDPTYGQLVQDLRAYMHALIVESDDELIPKFIRLGFHDCVGGICDGCVDLNDGDNKGLLEPMEALKDCSARFKHMVSRADCFAMAAIAASEAAAAKDETTAPADLFYPFTFIGRCDCVDSDDIGDGGPEGKCQARKKYTYFFFLFLVPILMYINLHSLLPPNSDLTTDQVIEFYSNDFEPAIGSKMSIAQFAVASFGSHAAAVGKCS